MPDHHRNSARDVQLLVVQCTRRETVFESCCNLLTDYISCSPNIHNDSINVLKFTVQPTCFPGYYSGPSNWIESEPN